MGSLCLKCDAVTPGFILQVGNFQMNAPIQSFMRNIKRVLKTYADLVKNANIE